MFITLKYSNFSVNVVFLSGVCLFWGGGGVLFLLWKSKRFSSFLFRPRFSFRAALTLTLRTTEEKKHIKKNSYAGWCEESEILNGPVWTECSIKFVVRCRVNAASLNWYRMKKVFVRNISNQHGLMYKKEESIFVRKFQYPEFTWEILVAKIGSKCRTQLKKNRVFLSFR